MRLRAALLIQVLLFLATSPLQVLQAGVIGGNELFPRCKGLLRAMDSGDKSHQAAFDSAYCGQYIAGFLDSRIFEGRERDRSTYCLPERFSIAQIARVIVKYLEDHPAKLHRDQGALVAESLMQEFPCTK
jgi:hypothetical protein